MAFVRGRMQARADAEIASHQKRQARRGYNLRLVSRSVRRLQIPRLGIGLVVSDGLAGEKVNTQGVVIQ